MRGEDAAFRASTSAAKGSPPHARGRRYYATFPCYCSTDHPRMRGEDLGSNLTKRFLDGSPPHARGRLKSAWDGVTDFGITPACAGKTGGDRQKCPAPPDHPRMRGEDIFPPRTLIFPLGSPPHARGRQGLMPGGYSCSGITPACAGKTSSAATLRTSPGDHPRMRGEDS